MSSGAHAASLHSPACSCARSALLQPHRGRCCEVPEAAAAPTVPPRVRSIVSHVNGCCRQEMCVRCAAVQRLFNHVPPPAVRYAHGNYARHNRATAAAAHTTPEPNLFHCTQACARHAHAYSSSSPPLLLCFFSVARRLRPGLPLDLGVRYGRKSGAKSACNGRTHTRATTQITCGPSTRAQMHGNNGGQ